MVLVIWSVGLVRRTTLALLDADAPPELAQQVRDAIETGNDRIADMRLWRVGPGCYAVILLVVSRSAQPPDAYRARLAHLPALRHVSVELERAAPARSPGRSAPD